MKNIFLIMLFAIGILLTSCQESNPQPTCEEGGTPVNFEQESNN